MLLTCSFEDEGAGAAAEGFVVLPFISRVKAFSGRADAFPAALSAAFSTLVLTIFSGAVFCFLVGGGPISPSSLLGQDSDSQE